MVDRSFSIGKVTSTKFDHSRRCTVYCTVFFFNDPASSEIYTLSLHDALPILAGDSWPAQRSLWRRRSRCRRQDRKSTRLNSSHGYISYAVFCLKKKNGVTQDSDTKECMIVMQYANTGSVLSYLDPHINTLQCM